MIATDGNQTIANAPAFEVVGEKIATLEGNDVKLSEPRRFYVWGIVLVNERMGFRKTCTPTAANLDNAVTAARTELVERGYDETAFVVVQANRGSFVRIA